MADNVTPLFGDPLPGEIDPEIIQKAEEFLARARAGEVCAFSIVWVRPNNMPAECTKHTYDTVNALHSGLVCTTARLTGHLNGEFVPAAPSPKPEGAV